MTEPSLGNPRRRLLVIAKNGPAVITILGSAVVALLSGIFKFSTEQFLQSILLLLAFLGSTLLADQLVNGRAAAQQLQEIDKHVFDLAARVGEVTEKDGIEKYISSRRDLEPLETRLGGAREVFISGGSLLRLINEYRRLFETLAEQGCKLRFVMADPDSAAAEHLGGLVSYEANSVDAYRSNMRDAISGLEALTAKHPTACKFKLSSAVPPFSLVLIRKSDEPAVMQVELYLFGLPARDRPILRLSEQRDPRLFKIFSEQTEKLWNLPGNQPPS